MIKVNFGNFNPDPIWHRNISFVKSAIRIAAGCTLLLVDANLLINLAGALLVAAEILGIVEELV